MQKHISKLKFIAAYQVAPVAAITHIAEVETILPWRHRMIRIQRTCDGDCPDPARKTVRRSIYEVVPLRAGRSCWQQRTWIRYGNECSESMCQRGVHRGLTKMRVRDRPMERSGKNEF